jgi:tRNA(Leu) C34 or U34 (ribose-2'-O)-methylase TrmL
MNSNIESLNISNTVSVVCHHIFQSKKWRLKAAINKVEE